MIDQLALARHEAGHAVVANVLGLRTVFLSIRHDSRSGGRWSFPPFPPSQARAFICAALAGRIAQEHFGHPLEPGCGDIDREFANSSFDHDIKAPDRAAYFAAREAEVRRLVADNAKVIDLVAQALVVCEQLHGRVVARLIERCTPENV